MASLVSFEISSDPSELKEILFMLGYQNRIPDKASTPIYLPSTTLYHHSKPPVQVLKEVEIMCRQLGIDLKKCVVCKCEEWAGLTGEPTG